MRPGTLPSQRRESRQVSGLRESKKAATRSALARAAAEIALAEGAEGLTVAAATAAAGVSPRTFHNYFASREEALSEFIAERIQALAHQFAEVPAELGLLDAVEHLVIETLHTDDDELGAFATLFRLGEIIETISPARGRPDIGTILEPLLDFIRPRVPGHGDFEARVLLQVVAAAVGTALGDYYAGPAPRDPVAGEELVRRATQAIRSL